MSKLFSMDSKFMKVMGRIGDLIILNFLYLITCIPIFTIGAATTALYTVCFRLGTGREQGTVKSYFTAFKDNFKQSTLLWLILLLILVTSFLNALVFFVMPAPLRYASVCFGLLFVLAVFITSYAFPLISQFNNRNKAVFKNALIMSLGYLPRTVVMAALNLLPWVLLLVNLYVFMQMSFLWVMLYFAAAAYINTRLFHKIFAPYMTEEEDIYTEEN